MTDRLRFDVAVIGAGMTGLTCAQQLQQMGYQVVVVEKSRGVGGRIATRRLYGTFADHGTCYLSPTGDRRFRELVEYLRQIGILQSWLDAIYELGPDGKLHIPVPEEHVRYYAAPQGMTAIAKFLTAGLDIRFNQRVTHLTQTADANWQIPAESITPEGSQEHLTDFYATAVVAAIPAPQAVSLLQPLAGNILSLDFISHLESVRFLPRLSVIAGYPASCYQDWLTQHLNMRAIHIAADPDLDWIGLDSSKRMTPSQPVFVIQSTAGFAERYLEMANLQPAAQHLLEQAAKRLAPWLATPEWMQIHRWRYAIAQTPLQATLMPAPTVQPLVCAGDWCGGIRVENAFLSGLAAADYINRQLQQHPDPEQPLWAAIANPLTATKNP